MNRFRLLVFISFALSSALAQETIQLSIMIGSSSGIDFVRDAANEYMRLHPEVAIEVLEGPARTDDLLAIYEDYFNSQEGVDILTLDVIWPGDMGDFMLDLYQFEGFSEAANEHFEAIIANNTTLEGELLAIPWFTDAGLLYYRTDLLEKYGFSDPPETWQELQSMAQVIQDGERVAGNEEFWGFVFQGREYEGLTVDALEWIASNEGGTFISSEGEVTVANPEAAEVLELVASWVDSISPPGVVDFSEEESRSVWQSGNAAFMRNWPYAYSLGNADDSAIAGKFAVAPLPAGEEGASVAGLGGWGLGIPNYSAHPEEAAAFALYLSSKAQQKQRAIAGSFAPTYPELYQDEEVLAAVPFFADFRTIVEHAVPRPSAVTSPNYAAVSRAIYRAVHTILIKERDAAEGLEVLAADLEAITGFPRVQP